MKLKTTHLPALNNAKERKDVSQREEKDQRKDVKEKDELKMAMKMANNSKMTKEDIELLTTLKVTANF